MQNKPPPNPKLVPTRVLRERYGGISDKTVDRWVASGVLPKPVKINNQRFWAVASLEAFERNLATKSSSLP